jgi:hypothetical protein
MCLQKEDLSRDTEAQVLPPCVPSGTLGGPHIATLWFMLPHRMARKGSCLLIPLCPIKEMSECGLRPS